MTGRSWFGITLCLAGLAACVAGSALACDGDSKAACASACSKAAVAAAPAEKTTAAKGAKPARVASAPAAKHAPAAAKKSTAAKAAAPAAAGQQGMRIFKDPETGQIGPPTDRTVVPEDVASRQDVVGLQQVTLPDGSVMIDLQGRFQESMVIQLDAHGHKVMRCVHDPKAAFKQTPVATAPQREDR